MPIPHNRVRAAYFRAARAGLSGRWFDPRSGLLHDPVHALKALLRHIEAPDEVTELARRVLATGNGAARQRRAWRRHIADVIDVGVVDPQWTVSPASALRR